MEIVLGAVIFVFGIVIGEASDNGPISAEVVLMTNSQLGVSQRLGIVTFTQSSANGPVQINGNLMFESRRDPVTRLGMHVHVYGNLTLGCDSTGPHFNPTGQHHGSQTEHERHVGDLGNIVVTNNHAKIDVSDGVIQLTGPHSIIGRALVIHQGEDDLGKGGNEESLKTGNAGKRFACGVIGLTSEKSTFQSSSGEKNRGVSLFLNILMVIFAMRLL